MKLKVWSEDASVACDVTIIHAPLIFPLNLSLCAREKLKSLTTFLNPLPATKKIYSSAKVCICLVEDTLRFLDPSAFLFLKFLWFRHRGPEPDIV